MQYEEREKRMDSHRIILSTGLLILVVVAGVCAAEIPPMPCEFYGNVSINGQPAPAGTLIEAKINGQTAGSLTTTTVGTYGGAGTFDARLVVRGFVNGNLITFFVNGSISNQSAVFQERNAQTLDLTMYNGMEPVEGVTLYPKGDFNHNWEVDIGDVTLVAYILVGRAPAQIPDADFNNNGIVDIGDVAKIAWFKVGKVPEL